MPVIAVVNRKGGSGKSTIATHIAAYCAHQGVGVMLGDVDRQQSTRAWLKLREQRHPLAKPITGWAINQSSALRAPTGISQVVLDTPGGLSGLDLVRVVMFSDAIVIPICNSVFDRDSAAQCYDELKLLPRIASGRCKLAVIGMRIDQTTRDSAMLTEWAKERGLPYLGGIRYATTYAKCIEQGMTLFDLPNQTIRQDLAQWRPLLDWMHPILFPALQPEALPVSAKQLILGSSTVLGARVVTSLPPVPPSSAQTERLLKQPLRQPSAPPQPVKAHETEKHVGFLEALGLPNFLRRK
jgi:chromosome partitioning protein